jgi:hypothetical protein
MCGGVVDAWEAGSSLGQPTSPTYAFDTEKSDARWYTREECEQGLAGAVVIWPGSQPARQLLAKLARTGLVLRDLPLLCKPVVAQQGGEGGGEGADDDDQDARDAIHLQFVPTVGKMPANCPPWVNDGWELRFCDTGATPHFLIHHHNDPEIYITYIYKFLIYIYIQCTYVCINIGVHMYVLLI